MKKYALVMLFVFLPFSLFSKDESKEKPPLNKPEAKLEQILPTTPEKGSNWGTDPDAFKEIEILDLVDENNSQRRWKEASSAYSAALQSFDEAMKAIQKKREEASLEVYYEDKYDWQKKARADNREREYAKQTAEARNFAVNQLIKGMNLLDKIENPKVKESESYIDLKAGIYREYIKHQDANKNYMQSVDFLERYIAMDDRFEKEAEPHRLLALAYEKLESFANKTKKKNYEEEWKELKKKHLIRFAELHYGRDSKEYYAIMERVARDF
jgi:hypothetical protein